MAKITETEAKKAIFQALAPLVADLSETLGYVVPIYWPALDYAQKPTDTVVYIGVDEVSSEKVALGIAADEGSDATEQLRVSFNMTERKGDLLKCQAAADKMIPQFSRGRFYFDLTNDKSVILEPCVREPLIVRDGRRVLSFLITYNFETY